ncbi:molybdenum cofactor biosynthesis protein MoaE [Caulobacter segnis]|uniref:molybdenum cofactor biosynthesis protein MoaE n=1 Tax=Caulobacter segnis TaxID=88688 RepID=UPI00240FE24C|nr:molybdenum cofactor biosynthesis protein MoaE [Caulobacter segnis]MDG2521600.1 molybdenum cofactor biosynthesis protein MoaE [Caulobacter segnis]
MIRLQTEILDVGALTAGFCADRSETGAVATFIGLARAEGGATRVLELEAYSGFTERQIALMVEEAIARFGLHDVAVVHRVGAVAPGEAVVFVATAAPHRREALQACDQLMDYLKSRAPFWKKEHGPDGARWIEPTGKDLADAERWDG